MQYTAKANGIGDDPFAFFYVFLISWLCWRGKCI